MLSERGDSNIKTSLIARESAIINRNISQFPQQLINALGDNSCPHRKDRNIYDIVAQLTAKLPIIRPQNKWLLSWHVLVMIAILYYIFQIGLLWGYGIDVWLDELAVLYALNCFFIIILIIDCFLNNIKAYYSHGLLVTHRRLIVKRYIKFRVYIDLIAIISICVPFLSGIYALNWIKALFFLKLYGAYQIDKEFIRVSQLKVSYHTFYLLSRLVLFLILGSHYLGIWFYMIDYWVYQNNYYGPNTPNICWIYNAMAYSQIVLLLPWYGQYLYTMYFSIGTMTTIAYGDITPLNPLQVLYITIALIAYTLGFAYILSQILRILMEAQASKFEHSNNLLVVSNLMKNNRIKQKTQSKVKSYFEKVWKQQIYRNRQVQNELIQKLPHKIRNELFTELYSSFFISSGLYYIGCENKVKTNFIVALANQIREQRLVQDHILYKQYQEYDPQNMNNHVFYFIKQLKKGLPKPSITIGVKDIIIETLKQGNFGIEAFYTGDPRDHWAQVILSVLVYQLPRKVLEDNIHLATQIQLQNIFAIKQTVYQKQCYICKEQGHNFKYCRYVSYQPNKSQIVKFFMDRQLINIQRNHHNKGQQGNQQNNKRRRNQFNTLIIFKQIKNLKYKIKHKYQMMIHDKYYSQFFMEKKKNKKKKSPLRINIEDKHFSHQAVRKPSLKGNLTRRKDSKNEIKQDQNTQIEKIKDNLDSQDQKNRNQIYNKIYRSNSLQFPKQKEIKQEEEHSSQQSSDQTSEDTSSDQESVDLQNYLKQTQLYIQHLEHLDQNINNTQNPIVNVKDTHTQEVQYDAAVQYNLYNVNYNPSQVIKKFNQFEKQAHKGQGRRQNQIFRRWTNIHQQPKKNKGKQMKQQTQREFIIEQEQLQQNFMSERSHSMRSR